MGGALKDIWEAQDMANLLRKNAGEEDGDHAVAATVTRQLLQQARLPQPGLGVDDEELVTGKDS